MHQHKKPDVHKLDPTFGPDKNGVTWFENPEQEDGFAKGITVAADGKLLIAASAGNKFSMVRLEADGTPDASFSNDGVVSGVFAEGYQSVGGSISILRNETILLDGDFYLRPSSKAQRGLAMFNSDGTPRLEFGDHGVKIVAPIPPPALRLSKVKPRQKRSAASENGDHTIELADGKLMVLSNHQSSFNHQCGLLIRLQSNGDLDTTFGHGDGYVEIRHLANFTWAGSLIRLQNGTFAVAGSVSRGDGYRAMIALFDAEGNLVSNFGDNGFALFDSLGTLSQINQLVEMPDGNILGIGSATAGNFVHSGVLICVDRNGKCVTTFNEGKPVLTSYPGAFLGIQWAAGTLREGGRIVVLSSTHGEQDSGIVIAQFKADGHPDRDFAENGLLVINLTDILDMPGGIAIQNNQIVVAGTSLLFGDRIRSFAFRCADTF
jgi:uncharacterized delta-60 repeat protein